MLFYQYTMSCQKVDTQSLQLNTVYRVLVNKLCIILLIYNMYERLTAGDNQQSVFTLCHTIVIMVENPPVFSVINFISRGEGLLMKLIFLEKSLLKLVVTFIMKLEDCAFSTE